MELDMNVPVFGHLAGMMDERKSYIVAGAHVTIANCDERDDYRKRFNTHAWHPFYLEVNKHHALQEYYPRAFKAEGMCGWDFIYILQLHAEDWQCRTWVLKHDGKTDTPQGVWFVEETAARRKLEELLGIFSGACIQSKRIIDVTKYLRTLRRTTNGLTLI